MTGPAPEQLPDPSGPGSVILDIGGDIGAAVVRTGPDLEGVELEIRAAGGDWTGRHVAVRPRPMPSGTVWAAVFEALPAGRYQVRRRGDDASPQLDVEVTGGSVADHQFPEGTAQLRPE